MKISFSLLLAALCGLASATTLRAQTTAFTYQGRLNQNEAPATGLFDVRFTLFGEATGGSPVSFTITQSVGATNGLFTVLLDFGSDPFTGADRWLDIAVRPAGGVTFTALTPRQPITPTPYALTALTAKQVPGVSGHALHAADGNPQNAVFVDDAGKVGVGTTSPQEKLDVRSGGGSYVRVDSANGDIRVNGGSDGQFGFFNDAFAAAAGTHLIGLGQSRLFVQNGGNVGIGTTTPLARLDVRGDIRMGTSGEVRAAGGEENLRIVRGTVNGQGGIVRGAGFNVVHAGGGDYLINFTTPFAGPPVLTVSVEYDENPGVRPYFATPGGTTAGSSGIVVKYLWTDGNLYLGDHTFHFTAIGPR